ncbi:MAG: flagellar motor protein MotB [Candidatus Cloacimonadota bacterium]|nr:MAG: flagellar motor protein MotB [Candidatus Cloacimonadota bacterium]
MAKKKKCPECPPVGAPEYMLTYGDMMTLLVTFFVLLISFSSVQESKFNQAMGSLKGAMGVLRTDAGAFILKQRVPKYSEGAGALEYELQKVLEEIENITEKQGTHEMINFTKSEDRINFNISNPMLFGSGQAVLRKDASGLLEKISSILKLFPYEIKVEGHTDNIPIHTAAFPSNWELSSARALAVVRKFVSYGVSPARFQAIGYGEFRPIATNDTSTGRAINRRVEISVSLKPEKNGSLLNDFEYEF